MARFMNMLRVIIASIFFCTITLGNVFAQTKTVPKKALKYYHQSEQKRIYHQYDAAKHLLSKAIKKYPFYTEAYAKLAEIHLSLEEYDAAKLAYSQILDIDNTPRSTYRAHYMMGKIEQGRGNYEKAIEHFNKSLEVSKIPGKIRDKVEWHLDNSQFAYDAMEHPVPFDPIRLDSTINTEHDEYLPMLTADEETLVFTRRINYEFNPEEDFYTSQADTTGWTMALNLGEPINSPSNEGAICISPDGSRMFFAAKDRKGGEGSFDIYYALKKGNKWVGPFNMGYPINTPNWESQPSISADGKALYFCSRRKGGFGGIDLWVSYLSEDNYWQIPINMGPNINTPGDEQSPFIHADNQTFYFSSNGLVGMGDADIYLVRKDKDGEWGEPENLGYPINTIGNENGLIVTASGEQAYYSSFSETTGLDIHYFNLPKKAKPIFVTYIKGRVLDAKTEAALSATIELIDLESGDTVLKTISDGLTGNFLTTLTTGKNYMYNVSKSGYLFYSENFSLKNHNPEEPYLIDILLNPVNVDSTINVGKTVVLKNVFFETASFDLKPASYPELDRLAQLLKDNPLLHIEIGGHTDSIGKAEYNLTLSENRAKSVYDYLVSKEIEATRLAYKGYADTKPIAANSNEAGRAINRRTEFTILENK